MKREQRNLRQSPIELVLPLIGVKYVLRPVLRYLAVVAKWSNQLELYSPLIRNNKVAL